MTPSLRRSLMLVPPVALGLLLLLHPMAAGTSIYDGIADDVTRALAVHVGAALLAPLVAVSAFLLLGGMRSRPATVARLALFPFVVGFLVWEANTGIGVAVLSDHANGLPASEQAVIADAIQALATSPLVGDPSLFGSIGNVSWVVAMVAAAVAFHRAGAGLPVTLLLGAASLFAMHPPPFGPIGLASFTAAAVLVERARAHAARPAPVAGRPSGMAPAGT
jgi:hypothetical protein